MKRQSVRRTSYVLRAITIVLLVIACAARLNACTCVCEPSRTVAEHVDASSGVVVAELVEAIDQTDTIKSNGERWSSSCGEAMLRLKVRDVLKGEFPRDLFVRQSAIGTGCDMQFQLQVGGTYLLFLRGASTCHVVSGCSPSQVFNEESPVLAATRAHLEQTKTQRNR